MLCGWLIFDGIRKETVAEMLGAEIGKFFKKGIFFFESSKFSSRMETKGKGRAESSCLAEVKMLLCGCFVRDREEGIEGEEDKERSL